MRLKLVALVMLLITFGCKPVPKCGLVFNYKTKTINVKLLKSKIKGLTEINIGDVSFSQIPSEVFEKVQALDLMQVLVCNQIESMQDGDQKESRKRELVGIYIEIMKSIGSSFVNSDLESFELKDLDYTRGKTEGYAVGYILAKLKKYYEVHHRFPSSLKELDVDYYLKFLGPDNLQYFEPSEGNILLRYSGQDKILLNDDDKIYYRRDFQTNP